MLKERTLLLLLVVAITPSLVSCEVEVFNQDDGLHIQQVNGTGEVSSAVLKAQRLLTRRTR